MSQTQIQTQSQTQSQSKLVPPHGSAELKPLLLEGEAREQALELASTLPTITLSSRERGDLSHPCLAKNPRILVLLENTFLLARIFRFRF